MQLSICATEGLHELFMMRMQIYSYLPRNICWAIQGQSQHMVRHSIYRLSKGVKGCYWIRSKNSSDLPFLVFSRNAAELFCVIHPIMAQPVETGERRILCRYLGKVINWLFSLRFIFTLKFNLLITRWTATTLHSSSGAPNKIPQPRLNEARNPKATHRVLFVTVGWWRCPRKPLYSNSFTAFPCTVSPRYLREVLLWLISRKETFAFYSPAISWPRLWIGIP